MTTGAMTGNEHLLAMIDYRLLQPLAQTLWLYLLAIILAIGYDQSAMIGWQ